MSANQAVFPIATMARVLGVSEAGYYVWRQRPLSAHAVADTALLKQVRTLPSNIHRNLLCQGVATTT